MSVDYLSNLLNRVSAKIDMYNERLLDVANKETKAASDEADSVFSVWRNKRVEEIFNESMDEFYDSFDPVFYDRVMGLKGTFTTELDDEWCDPERMHDGRGGNNYSGTALFDKVFVNGFHGGAENSGAGGVPYYRYGGHWTRPAVQTTPPKEIFSTLLEVAEGGEIYNKYEEIHHKYNDDAVEKVLDFSVQLQKEIFR